MPHCRTPHGHAGNGAVGKARTRRIRKWADQARRHRRRRHGRLAAAPFSRHGADGRRRVAHDHVHRSAEHPDHRGRRRHLADDARDLSASASAKPICSPRATPRSSRVLASTAGSTGDEDDFYYHPFTPPPEGEALDLVSLARATPGAPFGFAVSAQPAICQAQLAPRQQSMPPYAGALNYAYHLDAAKLAARLSKHAVERLGSRTFATKWSHVELSRRRHRCGPTRGGSGSRAICSSTARGTRRC